MIHIGDKVKIGHTGAAYTTYPGFLDYYRDAGSASTVIERVCRQYEYGRSPTETEAHDKVFTVMFIREHGYLEGKTLAVINDGSITYIIDACALTLVSSDIPFKEGDKVYIKDTGKIYSVWKSLIRHVSTAIPDGEKVRRKWTKGNSPTPDEIGGKSPEAIFTVKWVGHHISRPNEAITAIISNNTNAYIIGVNGLARAGEKSWENYVLYVRNWAVANKDSAQSVRDAVGPKPYAEWLSDKR